MHTLLVSPLITRSSLLPVSCCMTQVLVTGRVPPIANFVQKETDPHLGPLKFSRGGDYPCKYAMRFAAGFGSQIALALYGVDK